MKIQIQVDHQVRRSIRVQQLEALFDVPASDKMQIRWDGDLPIEDFPWNVGLIVGPSGCGKTKILEACFGKPLFLWWTARAVVDDFDEQLSMDTITQACSAVGFNTIPAWMRPHDALSNGERFRVEIARAMLEDKRDVIPLDEFTSVVDRQVARIAAYATQKYVRRNNRKFVAATCHYDVVDWLDPDWILEPASMTFARRSLRGRPKIEVEIQRVAYKEWKLFAPYHYLTPELNKAARCFGAFVNDSITTFTGILHRPHPRAHDIVGISRVVTLPDWQGLGLAMVLLDVLGSAYRVIGKRLHNYPAHPSFIRAHARSKNWVCVKAAGDYSPRRGSTSSVAGFGGRPCAVFAYVGPAMPNIEDARRLIGS